MPSFPSISIPSKIKLSLGATHNSIAVQGLILRKDRTVQSFDVSPPNRTQTNKVKQRLEKMSPKLYVMPASPPCRAVLMIAKAIGLELEVEEVEKEALRTPEMLELNPQHTVPLLVDEDFVLWDSHAIAGYLVGQYAEDDCLYPKDDVRKRAVIDQRLHFENGVLYVRCYTATVPLFTGTGDISEDDRDKLIEAYGFLEEFLNGRPWLAGDDMTIADLSVLATVATSDLLIPVEADRFPQLSDWLKTGKELPYFEECNAEGIAKFKEMLATPEA